MPANDDLKESLSLMQELKKLADEKIHNDVEHRRILRSINSIQKEINNSLKDQTPEQRELLNIQKKISDIGSKIKKEYEAGIVNVDKIVKLQSQLRKAKIEELQLTKSIALQDKFKADIADLLKELGLEKAVESVKTFNKEWEKSRMLAVLGLATAMFKDFVGIFNKVEGAAADFRIRMGFIRVDTAAIEDNMRKSFFRLSQTGLEAKDLYNSFEAIAQTIGTIQATTTAMAEDMALLTVQLGVAQDTAAGFAMSMAMMGKSTMDAQKDIALFTSRLSAAAGTNLNEVMKDVATASQTGYIFMTRNSISLAKAAVEAKKMGTSLQSAATSAEQLIKFTSSVRAELDASVLLGESINLQRARELAYRKDIAGLNKEILDIAKKTRFEELDPFQQEAVAGALGKSAAELGKMLQADREMARIRADSNLAGQVKEYDRMAAANDDLVKSTAQSAREQLRVLSNQQALKAIALSLKSIYTSLFEPFVYAAAHILPPIAKFFGIINEKLGRIGGGITGILVAVGLLVGSRYLGKLVSWAMGGVGKSIGNMLGGVVGGVKAFGGTDVLRGAAGLFIVAASLVPLAFAMKLMEGVNWKTFAIMAASLAVLTVAVISLGALMTGAWPLVLAGAAAMVLIGASLIPTAFAFKIFSQALKSLADVDLIGIAVGLASLSIPLFKIALLTPAMLPLAAGMAAFSVSLRLVAGPMERVGIASMNLGIGLHKTADALSRISDLSLLTIIGQFKDLTTMVKELNAQFTALPDIKIEKIQQIVTGAVTLGQQESKSNEEILQALSAIKTSLDNLQKGLETGGIAANVYIDTQKMDSMTARALSFKGTKIPQPVFS